MFGKIYKIVDNTNNNVYIGSTFREPSIRLNEHINDHKEHMKGIGCHVSSSDIIANNNYSLIVIEQAEFKYKNELLEREKFWIRNTPNVINKCIPLRKMKEWEEDHPGNKKMRDKLYYARHRDKIKEKTKQYRTNNKEAKIIRDRKYAEENKQKIKEKQSSKYTCICGRVIARYSKSFHEKSKLHIDWINNPFSQLNYNLFN